MKELKWIHLGPNQRIDITISLSPYRISRSQAKKLIEQSCIFVDGILVTKPKQLILQGQKIRIELPKTKSLDVQATDLGLHILFEDDEIAIIDKPANLSVHPSHTEQGATIVHGLLHALKSLSSIGGIERPGIVHRLDKGTSGVLVVSKTDNAHQNLSTQFKAHSIERRYLALVYGQPKVSSATIKTLIGRSPVNRKKMSGKVKRGRTAITHWKIRDVLEGLTLLECRLETGRTHQIRVHLSEAGFPIVGDLVYGNHQKHAQTLVRKYPKLGKALIEVQHQLLHAYFLGFKHPKDNRLLEFESPLPKDFAEIVNLAKK